MQLDNLRSLFQAQLDFQVPPELRVSPDNLDRLDLTARLVVLELQDSLESTANPDQSDHPDGQGRKVHRVRLGLRDSRGRRDPEGLPASLDSAAWWVRLGFRGPRAYPDSRALLDRQERLDFLERPEQLEVLGTRDHVEGLDQPERLEPLAQPGPRVPGDGLDPSESSVRILIHLYHIFICLTVVVVVLTDRSATTNRGLLAPAANTENQCRICFQYKAEEFACAVSSLCPVYFCSPSHNAPPVHNTGRFRLTDPYRSGANYTRKTSVFTRYP